MKPDTSVCVWTTEWNGQPYILTNITLISMFLSRSHSFSQTLDCLSGGASNHSLSLKIPFVGGVSRYFSVSQEGCLSSFWKLR